MIKNKQVFIKEILKDYNLLLWYKQDYSDKNVPFKTIEFENFRWHVFEKDYKKVLKIIKIIKNLKENKPNEKN